MSADNLQVLYGRRFTGKREYRQKVWGVLTHEFFQRFIEPADAVLDLGCGYGEFINQVSASKKYAMDLNPDTAGMLAPGIIFFHQDCSQPWPLPDNTLGVVFTSNFFEHLPNKVTLGRALEQACRCLKPGGRLIALGPNIRHLPGAYWDFWDHYLPLSEASLAEGLVSHGFHLERCWDRFLPYSMVNSRDYPLLFLRLYLRFPLAWRFLGKQFLVIAQKPCAS